VAKLVQGTASLVALTTEVQQEAGKRSKQKPPDRSLGRGLALPEKRGGELAQPADALSHQRVERRHSRLPAAAKGRGRKE
jgi:hypothetical protein